MPGGGYEGVCCEMVFGCSGLMALCVWVLHDGEVAITTAYL